MKIGYILNKGDNVGGFPQHAELSIKGLKELGNSVDFIYLDYYEHNRTDYVKKIKEDKEQVTYGCGTGIPYHPYFGWYIKPLNYKGDKNINSLINKLEKYDAIFWHTPFWFKQKKTLKETSWVRLFQLENPIQIAFVHDANLRNNTAWTYFISKHFDYIINVHQASYNSCSVLEQPRTLIFNPQDLSKVDKEKNNFDNIKKTGNIFSMQNWKASKRVDELIRAIPYTDKELNFKLAGKGIEYNYIFGSIEKMKEEYFISSKKDPDYKKENGEMTIGNKALGTGRVDLLGWINSEQKNIQYKNAAFFIDTAWYKINLELGGHFSRVLIESMINGIVPIARNLGLSGNLKGKGEVFEAGKNYIMIPYDATPKQFAEILNKAKKISREEYTKIVSNNYEILKNFDYLSVCKQYVDVIKGKDTGFYNKYENGKSNIKFIKKAISQWYGTGDKRTFNFKEERKGEIQEIISNLTGQKSLF